MGSQLAPGPLRVAAGGRSLTDSAGTPFFYFADTCWFAVWKGTAEQWERYLDLRAEQGFSVVQVHLLPFHWDEPDAGGNHPFHDDDVSRPNETYFRRFDQFIELAAERGIYTGLYLIWAGDKFEVHSQHFNTEQASAFMRYAAERFGHHPVLWSVSGDGPYAQDLARWEEIGAALEAADARQHPTTNHLLGWMNWHFLHHASPWHDFHMYQSGHTPYAYAHIAGLAAAYYKLEPPKPAVNGEPWYEGHPANLPQGWGRSCTPYDVRYAFWVGILSGCTMGHTYGGQGVWNWKLDADPYRTLGAHDSGPPWHEAMRREGAAQCALGARLLGTLPWWELRPAPEYVHLDPRAGSTVDSLRELERAFGERSGIGEPSTYPMGCFRPVCATAAAVWVIYLPAATGDLVVEGVPDGRWRARWVDPRTGEAHTAGQVEPHRARRWRAPAAPSVDDWILILERSAGSIGSKEGHAR